MSDPDKSLEDLKDCATIVAVAQMATLMAAGINAGMSPKLVLALVEDVCREAFVPLTRAGRELILDTVLKTLSDDLDGLTNA